MKENTKKERKGLSPKTKRIINIVVTSLQVAVVVLTVAISIFVWTTSGKGDTESEKKFQMLAIRTGSMMGDKPDSFNPGDLIIVTKPEDTTKLKAGDVIAYKIIMQLTNGYATTINTHRIVGVNVSEQGSVTYITKGDNNESADIDPVSSGDVVGVYSYKLKGIGALLLWLQGYEKIDYGGADAWDYAGNTNNFLWVIIIPLIGLLLWNGYALIRVIIDAKLKKAREEAAMNATAAAAAAIDAEEIKRRAIEEYLAKLSAENAGKPPVAETVSADSVDTGNDTPESK